MEPDEDEERRREEAVETISRVASEQLAENRNPFAHMGMSAEQMADAFRMLNYASGVSPIREIAGVDLARERDQSTVTIQGRTVDGAPTGLILPRRRHAPDNAPNIQQLPSQAREDTVFGIPVRLRDVEGEAPDFTVWNQGESDSVHPSQNTMEEIAARIMEAHLGRPPEHENCRSAAKEDPTILIDADEKIFTMGDPESYTDEEAMEMLYAYLVLIHKKDRYEHGTVFHVISRTRLQEAYYVADDSLGIVGRSWRDIETGRLKKTKRKLGV